ncbi:hypothetical protein [Frateuria terrea]|uniref:hypothetical protein n=1 Tax=Frateuria terrea TaxID=529704 RepID=UPI001587306F|nr:hypothetical protein [Frateuria terrea]
MNHSANTFACHCPNCAGTACTCGCQAAPANLSACGCGCAAGLPCLCGEVRG